MAALEKILQLQSVRTHFRTFCTSSKEKPPLILNNVENKEQSSTFWNKPNKKPSLSRRVAASFMLVSCLAYASSMKTEAKCSLETSVGVRWKTRHYIIPTDRNVF
jgi:hypothetical protein